MRNGDCELLIIGNRNRVCGEDARQHVYMNPKEIFALCVSTSNPCLVNLRVHGFSIGTFCSPTRRFIRESKKPPLTVFTFESPPPAKERENKHYGVIKAKFAPITDENRSVYEELRGVEAVIDKFAPQLREETSIQMYLHLDDPKRLGRRHSRFT